ncbi:type II toxin-antitoxin system RelE/ParE family toxin [uncultured Christiangramia sp.]|uniref:type II toxin-antitoxin system RelE/ParE family toxin n=1 Tax=uncultured Christiangramia sp. TaxID=503836 RepID=UPI00262367BD|nr:type II toxin-antitoxin system RelE/ParE family toxin [uncultured Christiangramia sp.]
MANYKLSTRAAMDIAEIYEYGIFKFGLNQAQSYLNGLEENLGVLVTRPELSRKADYISQNLYRFKYQSHIVFFTLAENDAFVVRILEQHRDFSRHL